jgi:hypothetical protein
MLLAPYTCVVVSLNPLGASALATEPDYSPGEVIVKLSPSCAPSTFLADSLCAALSLEAAQRISLRKNVWLFRHSVLISPDSVCALLLSQHPDVSRAEPNYRIAFRDTPNDSLFADQWSLHNAGQTGGSNDADIDALEAWNLVTSAITQQGDTLVLAVMDSGFLLTHPDINFWKNRNEIPSNQIDDDANGYVDDYDGWDAVDNNGIFTSPTAHGTGVAGVAGAYANNTKGVAGVSWKLKILPVRLSNAEPFTYLSRVLIGFDYVETVRMQYDSDGQGAFVIAVNNSFGVDDYHCADLEGWNEGYNSLGQLGILSVASTRNYPLNVDDSADTPSDCQSEYLIVTTSTDDEDALKASYGPVNVDIGAPGEVIRLAGLVSQGLYQLNSGTSYAAPHVSGAIALMYAAAPTGVISAYKSTPATVALDFKRLALATVDSIPDLIYSVSSGGRLNLDSAVRSACALDPTITAAWEPTGLWPPYVTAACPAGDGNKKFTVTIATETACSATLASTALSLEALTADPATRKLAFFPQSVRQIADSATTSGNSYTTTITERQAGGCGSGVAEVYLHGVKVGDVTVPAITNFDLTGNGSVDAGDIAVLATSVGSCEQAQNYDPCANFVQFDPNAARCIDPSELSAFAAHIGHNQSNPLKEAVEGSRKSSFVVHPGTTEDILVVTLRLEGILQRSAFGVVLRLDRSNLDFLDWSPSQGLAGRMGVAVGTDHGEPRLSIVATDVTPEPSGIAVIATLRFQRVTYGASLESIGLVFEDVAGLPTTLASEGDGRVEATEKDALLSQNHPNPFNPRTTIRFRLTSEADVQLVVFDVTGREVRRLIDARHTPGLHSIEWDGCDDLGRPLCSGIYLCRVTAAGRSDSRKLVLLR